MLNALNRLWAAFFMAVVLFLPAGAVTGLWGVQVGLTFWIMGICAHQPLLNAANQSFGRRLLIWLTAMAMGVITVGFGMLAVSALSPVAFDTPSSSVGGTIVFWFVVSVRVVTRWAPVMMAWAVSGALVRRARPSDDNTLTVGRSSPSR